MLDPVIRRGDKVRRLNNGWENLLEDCHPVEWRGLDKNYQQLKQLLKNQLTTKWKFF